jgi:hypothetical protein
MFDGFSRRRGQALGQDRPRDPEGAGSWVAAPIPMARRSRAVPPLICAPVWVRGRS